MTLRNHWSADFWELFLDSCCQERYGAAHAGYAVNDFRVLNVYLYMFRMRDVMSS